MEHASYTPAEVTNIATHLVGLLGVAYYYLFLLRQRVRSQLENKLAIMLGLFSVGLLGRCLYWYSHQAESLRLLLDSLGPILPLVYSIFAEALMKRHMTKVMKYYFVLTTLFFFAGAWLNLLGPGGALRLPFVIHLCLFMAFMTRFMISPRVRAGLTSSEIAIANTNLATLWIALPFYAVDFLPIQSYVHLKYDMLGALFFTYSTLRIHRSGDGLGTIFREVGNAFRIALAASLMIILASTPPDAYGYLRIFVMVLCLCTLWIIVDRIRYLNLRSRDYPFLSWLANVPMSNLQQFIDELKALKVSEDFVVLHESELDGYQVREIAAFLARRSQGLLRKDEAVRLARQSSSEDAFVIEQILDLMKRHRMDSATVLRTEPVSLYLAQISQVGQVHRVNLEVKILQKVSGLIQ